MAKEGDNLLPSVNEVLDNAEAPKEKSTSTLLQFVDFVKAAREKFSIPTSGERKSSESDNLPEKKICREPLPSPSSFPQAPDGWENLKVTIDFIVAESQFLQERLTKIENLEMEVTRLRPMEHYISDVIRINQGLEEQVYTLERQVVALQPAQQQLHEATERIAFLEASLQEWMAVGERHGVQAPEQLNEISQVFLAKMTDLEMEVRRLRANECLFHDAIRYKLTLEAQIHHLMCQVETMQPAQQQLHEATERIAYLESSLQEWAVVAHRHGVESPEQLNEKVENQKRTINRLQNRLLVLMKQKQIYRRTMDDGCEQMKRLLAAMP